jgi:hypothetical protein
LVFGLKGPRSNASWECTLEERQGRGDASFVQPLSSFLGVQWNDRHVMLKDLRSADTDRGVCSRARGQRRTKGQGVYSQLSWKFPLMGDVVSGRASNNPQEGFVREIQLSIFTVSGWRFWVT